MGWCQGGRWTRSKPAGKPDISKIKPMVLNLEESTYSTIGPVIAKAFGVGREFKPKA